MSPEHVSPPMLTLPFHLTQHIYSMLPPADRVKFRLALPKEVGQYLANSWFEQNLWVAHHHIQKHKPALVAKEKALAPAIAKFLQTHSSHDPFIQSLCQELGLTPTYTQGNDTQVFLEDVAMNRVTVEKTYCLSNKAIHADWYDYSNSIAECSPITFDNIQLNPSLVILKEVVFKTDLRWERFMFNVLNRRNEPLLSHIVSQSFPGAVKYATFIQNGISYLTSLDTLEIFSTFSSMDKIRILSRYAPIPRESLLKLQEDAEEAMNVHTVMGLAQLLRGGGP